MFLLRQIGFLLENKLELKQLYTSCTVLSTEEAIHAALALWQIELKRVAVKAWYGSRNVYFGGFRMERTLEKFGLVVFGLIGLGHEDIHQRFGGFGVEKFANCFTGEKLNFFADRPKNLIHKIIITEMISVGNKFETGVTFDCCEWLSSADSKVTGCPNELLL